MKPAFYLSHAAEVMGNIMNFLSISALNKAYVPKPGESYPVKGKGGSRT